MAAPSYADALDTLYRAPLGAFVAERKRLALELKSVDKALAKTFEKLSRPSLSAWAVNQLWWHAREDFEALMAAAERLRHGDREASAQHRDYLVRLRTLAAQILEEGGHTASDTTLRRVTTSLAALAARGGFAPDPPGALATDRDPPGFEVLTSPEAASAAPSRPEPPRAAPSRPEPPREDERRELERRELERREAERCEAERCEAERCELERRELERRELERCEAERCEAERCEAERRELERRELERQRLRAALDAAREAATSCACKVNDLRRALDAAEGEAALAQRELAAREAELAAMDPIGP